MKTPYCYSDPKSIGLEVRNDGNGFGNATSLLNQKLLDVFIVKNPTDLIDDSPSLAGGVKLKA